MDRRPGSVGTLASQIRGYEVVRQYMTSSSSCSCLLTSRLRSFFSFMWVLAGPIVWVPMTLLPVGIILGLALRGPIERYTALNVRSNRRNGLLVEALDGAETLKAGAPSGRSRSVGAC